MAEYMSYHNPEHYASSHSVFKKSIVKDQPDHLLAKVPSIIRPILDNNNQGLGEFNVLSAGCGDGTVDVQIVEIILDEFNRRAKYRDTQIAITAIEPNRRYVDAYNQAIETMPELVKQKCSFDIRLMTSDEYLSQHHDKTPHPRFHLILFIHSLYYIDIDKTLPYCLNKMLNHNGKAVVLLDEKGVLFSVDLDDDMTDIDTLPCEQVLRVLTDNQWEFTDFKGEYKMEVSSICDSDSSEGNLLLDFFMHQVNFRANATKDQMELVEKSLKENVEMTDGKMIGKVYDRLFVISKP